MSAEQECWPSAVNIGEVVYPPRGRFGPRQQTTLQLVMLHSGEMRVEIDGIRHAVAAGTVCVLLPGHEEFFAFAEERETHHSWVHIFLSTFPPALLARLQCLDWPLPLTSAMLQLLYEALAIQRQPFPTTPELLKALAVQMLWRYIGEGEQRASAPALRAHALVEQTRQYIHAHLHEPLTLEQLAALVAVSPAHLIRLFTSNLNITPMSYVWQRRVAKGIELLEQTGLPVGTIAEQCGFQSRYHFSRRVRQTIGATPLEVRRRSWRLPGESWSLAHHT